MKKFIPLLHALLSSNGQDVEEWLKNNHLTTEQARWLHVQGLAPYIYIRLRHLNLLPSLADNTDQYLKNAYYGASLIEAIQHQEATKLILSALAEANIQNVLMKGMALAHTVYPNPRCRQKGDLDIWIQAEEHSEAIAALQKVSYHPRDKKDRPPIWMQLFGGDIQMVSEQPYTGLIELQWPAIRCEWVRLTADVDHAGMWERCEPFLLEGQPTAIMALEDMLLHVCLHQAINHQFDRPWLRNLLDVHLMALQSSIAWQEVVQRAHKWRMATVTWTVLLLSCQLLGTPVPEAVLTALSPSPRRCQLIKGLRLEDALLSMRKADGYEHRRLLIQWFLIDRPQDALKLLRHALFPTADWIEARYSTSSTAELWRARVLHPWQVLISAKA
jgi:hypothetical protein